MNHRIVFVLVLAGSCPALAQTTLGTITGRVTDATGASIAGAAVTAKNTERAWHTRQ
ncbi:MAG: carboxypeptidase-like regulatory domain-containing protein [Acidobacteriota bacterium]|nr:carboxypeptidase-like regulatory domain-containing protein [Acidobacteriota bacterium]